MKNGKLKGEVVTINEEKKTAMVKIHLRRGWPEPYGYGKVTSYSMEIWPLNELTLKTELSETLYDDGEL